MLNLSNPKKFFKTILRNGRCPNLNLSNNRSLRSEKTKTYENPKQPELVGHASGEAGIYYIKRKDKYQ